MVKNGGAVEPQERKGVEEVMKGGFKMAYGNKVEYYVRVINALMALCPEKAHLDPKTVSILAVMCVVSDRGGDHMKREEVSNELERNGMKKIGEYTLRNYRVKMRKGGWLIKRKMNKLLQGAIDDQGMGFGIFYHKAKK